MAVNLLDFDTESLADFSRIQHGPEEEADEADPSPNESDLDEYIANYHRENDARDGWHPDDWHDMDMLREEVSGYEALQTELREYQEGLMPDDPRDGDVSEDVNCFDENVATEKTSRDARAAGRERSWTQCLVPSMVTTGSSDASCRETSEPL